MERLAEAVAVALSILGLITGAWALIRGLREHEKTSDEHVNELREQNRTLWDEIQALREQHLGVLRTLSAFRKLIVEHWRDHHGEHVNPDDLIDRDDNG